MGVQGAYKRAVLAFGAQRRVQRPQWRLGRGGGDDVGELGGQVRADLHELLLADRLLNVIWIVGGADDVDDVDVRDVVELAGPRSFPMAITARATSSACGPTAARATSRAASRAASASSVMRRHTVGTCSIGSALVRSSATIAVSRSR